MQQPLKQSFTHFLGSNLKASIQVPGNNLLHDLSSLSPTVLPAKSDSDIVFCLHL